MSIVSYTSTGHRDKNVTKSASICAHVRGKAGQYTLKNAYVSSSYLLVAAPTYILPYFGSNSSVINITGAALGLGALPQFWFRLVALYLLVVVAWFRGVLKGRPWLSIFPLLASIFDMVPGLNVVPLIPTIFHVLALTLGVSAKVVPKANAIYVGPRPFIEPQNFPTSI